MINRVLQSVKMSYSLARGSVLQREQKADRFCEGFFNTIIKDFPEQKSCMKYMDLKRKIKAYMPENLNLDVYRINYKDCEGIIDFYGDDFYNIHGYIVGITNNVRKIIPATLPLVLHELCHVADYIYNPKLIAIEQRMFKRGLNTKKFRNFYEKFMYEQPCYPTFSTEKERQKYLLDVEKKLRKYISKNATQDKITILQSMRQYLKLEDRAYTKQVRIAKKLIDKGYKVWSTDISDRTYDYQFKEKIKIVNRILSEVLQNERSKLKSR